MGGALGRLVSRTTLTGLVAIAAVACGASPDRAVSSGRRCPPDGAVTIVHAAGLRLGVLEMQAARYAIDGGELWATERASEAATARSLRSPLAAGTHELVAVLAFGPSFGYAADRRATVSHRFEVPPGTTIELTLASGADGSLVVRSRTATTDNDPPTVCFESEVH